MRRKLAHCAVALVALCAFAGLSAAPAKAAAGDNTRVPSIARYANVDSSRRLALDIGSWVRPVRITVSWWDCGSNDSPTTPTGATPPAGCTLIANKRNNTLNLNRGSDLIDVSIRARVAATYTNGGTKLVNYAWTATSQDDLILYGDVDLSSGENWDSTPAVTWALGGPDIALRTSGGFGTGAVTFAKVGAGASCTLASGVAEIVKGRNDAGYVCTIEATKAATFRRADVQTDDMTLTLSKASQTALVLTPGDDNTLAKSANVNLGTTGGSGTGTVTYAKVAAGSDGTCTNPVSGVVTMPNAFSKTCKYNATKAGDDQYEPVDSNTGTFTTVAS